MTLQSSGLNLKSFSLILFISLSAVLPGISHNLMVTAQAGLPLISVAAPQAVTAPETMVFNISVMLDSSDATYVSSYQLYMTVDDTMLSTENGWLSTDNSSWIFHGESYMPVDPVRLDDDDDGVFDGIKWGAGLLPQNGEYDSVSVTGPVLLGTVGLHVRGTGTAILNISTIQSYYDPIQQEYQYVNATFVEDPYGEEINVERQNGQVEIQGDLPSEPSTISLEVSPSPALAGQNVTITGQIIPDKPNVDVKIEQRQNVSGSYLPWVIVATVKTNQTSHYNYVHSFQEAGTYQVKASWAGDETHQGNVSLLEIVVGEPEVGVAMRFSDETLQYIGEYYLQVPTKPETINVTVRNVTDLYQWRVKIYYNPNFIDVIEIPLSADNALNLTGLEYNFTSELGEDDGGDYLLCEATITEAGNGYTGNATLFQFNVTGLVVTIGTAGTGGQSTTLNVEECILKNSTGSSIPYGWDKVVVVKGSEKTTLFEEGVFYVIIAGSFSTSMRVLNPRTGNNQFTFYSNDTFVGAVFNVTVRVGNATDLYGWRVILTYNHRWLNVTRVIKPEGDAAYVFYGKESTMDYVLNEGSVEINETSADVEPFEGSGLLVVVEFEIVSLATNETGDLRGDLALDESSVFTGVIWQSVLGENAGYWMIYGAETEDGGPSRSWLERYWPYLVAVGVVVLVVYLALRILRKRRAPPV